MAKTRMSFFGLRYDRWWHPIYNLLLFILVGSCGIGCILRDLAYRMAHEIRIINYYVPSWAPAEYGIAVCALLLIAIYHALFAPVATLVCALVALKIGWDYVLNTEW